MLLCMLFTVTLSIQSVLFVVANIITKMVIKVDIAITLTQVFSNIYRFFSVWASTSNRTKLEMMDLCKNCHIMLDVMILAFFMGIKEVTCEIRTKLWLLRRFPSYFSCIKLCWWHLASHLAFWILFNSPKCLLKRSLWDFS